jgi:hypothetical protein
MIAHVSMPADDCAHVAKLLAEMMHGGAFRFPPGGPNAWNAWSKKNDFQIVVTPRGHFMVEGPGELEWTSHGSSGERASETHFAIAVERPAVEIVDMARAAGWHARICNRGGFFDLVEVWVENAYLVEVLDPTQLSDYQRAMTVENWKRAFGLGSQCG